MAKKAKAHAQNPAMAEARLHINAFLMGSIFTVLTIIWTFSTVEVKPATIIQLVLAIPLIFFASLSYAKVGYHRSHKIWYNFGWITNNIGYLLFFNSIGLMVEIFSSMTMAILYFCVVIALSSCYYILNIISQPGTRNEHLMKLALFIVIILIGGILQM